MFDAKEELLAKIRLGEDSLLELKTVRFKGGKVDGPSRDDLADELAAFANTREGMLVLGVDDKTRDVDGIPLDKLDLVEGLVREVCNDSIKPPLAPLLIRMTLPDTTGAERAILKVEIPRSLFVHESPSGYFHRVGSSKRKMPPDYLARLFQQRSQSRLIRFDEQVVAGASLDDLDASRWERFRTSQTRDSREDLLQKLGMARRDENGAWAATVCGILLASTDPRHWLPNAFVQAVAYRGSGALLETVDPNYQLDAKDISGPLDEQVIDACRFVARNAPTRARKDVGRIDLPGFDMTAVFEALVNAVAHRDYSIYGSKIRLRLHPDRLVITSPGALPNTMSVESLPFRQAARNEAITSLLARCPVPDTDWLTTDRRTMMDKRGEGVQIILERSRELSGRAPVYRMLDDAELELTIFAARDASDAGAGPGTGVP